MVKHMDIAQENTDKPKKNLPLNNDISSSNIQDYLKRSITCSCGHTHQVPIKEVIIEENAIMHLPKLLTQLSCKKAFFLYDATTYLVAGQKVEQILDEMDLPYSHYILEVAPIPNEETLGKVLIHYDLSCDVIIAVGSGTINDISRFVSHRLTLPYLIIATAPSMDGFASTVAPLIVDHMKTTYEAHAPYAILGDVRILMEAPIEMIAAGIGDILGKYTCLCDWKLSHIIQQEYHCSFIENIVHSSIDTVLEHVDGVLHRDPKAIQSIMEALVLSGIAMSFAGNSRPASGSEHHLSHYWEMMFLFQGKKPILHGTKVGIGTIAVLKAYEFLKEKETDFSIAVNKATDFSYPQWESLMLETYGKAAPSVIALEHTVGKNMSTNVIPRLTTIENKWKELLQLISTLPSADDIRQLLSHLSAPSDPMSCGIDKATFINSFLVAKELRNRYGLLQLLHDLSLTEFIASEVWDYFYAK